MPKPEQPVSEGKLLAGVLAYRNRTLPAPEQRHLKEQLAAALEFILLNEAALENWRDLLSAATGTLAGEPWNGAARWRSVLLQLGPGGLPLHALARLALDIQTIKSWSERILDTVPDFWWRALHVHGQRLCRRDAAFLE